METCRGNERKPKILWRTSQLSEERTLLCTPPSSSSFRLSPADDDDSFDAILLPWCPLACGACVSRVSLLSRLSALDPESLSIALYPEMQGYATPDIRLANSLSLSR